ncbi:MAG: PGF-CTERM sorting domain-containing protein, partial [Halobacteria archaeon]
FNIGPGNLFALNPGGDVVIDPSRFFRVFASAMLSSNFGVRIIDSLDGEIISSLIRFNDIGVRLENATNITIRDSVILDSGTFDLSDPAIPAPVAILGSFYQGTRVSNFTIVPLASLPTQSISIEVNRQYLGLYSDGSLVAFLPNPIPPSFNVTRSKAVGHNVTTDENISISTETGRVGLIALFSPFSGAQSSGTICYDNVALSCLQSSCAVMNEPVSPAALVVSPGFEVVFAVAGLLAMAHLARRRNGRDRLQ